MFYCVVGGVYIASNLQDKERPVVNLWLQQILYCLEYIALRGVLVGAVAVSAVWVFRLGRVEKRMGFIQLGLGIGFMAVRLLGELIILPLLLFSDYGWDLDPERVDMIFKAMKVFGYFVFAYAGQTLYREVARVKRCGEPVGGGE